MNSSRIVPRSLSIAPRASKGPVVQRRCFRAANSSRVAVGNRSTPRARTAAFLLSATVGAGSLYLIYPSQLHAEAAEAVPAPGEVRFEERSEKGLQDLTASQHQQAKKSWEEPGVYAWGSNSGRVIDPDSDETIIKKPRRIAYFDGKLIRDIKLDRNFAAAIDENGDLLQWGVAFSPSCQGPTPTLRGKDLVKISLSRDRIIALSSNGTVYSIAASQADHQSGPKPQETSWIPFLKSESPVNYRTLTPSNMDFGERVTDISSGLDHCLILTSQGRLFSAASGTEDFPSRGQLGIPGLTWMTRPPGPHDQPHEISTLRGFEIAKIAAGAYHSLVADKEGRVWSFGDNSSGQLGFDLDPESPTIDAPSLIPIDKLYKGANLLTRVTNVAAGGANSFFTVDATKMTGRGGDGLRGLGQITADTWACGEGIFGALGNGRWTHVQDTPTKVKALSGLFEYDEVTNTASPIRLSHLSAGATHACAILNNGTNVAAGDRSTENDINWGSDVLWWGGNEFFQVGTGKRSNVNNPTYIAPLDAEADMEKGRAEEPRFQITPRTKITLDGRDVNVEQRVECGRGVTAVYSSTCEHKDDPNSVNSWGETSK
jgi:alpha-tubulin suppressor-like RCC1 family protein